MREMRAECARAFVLIFDLASRLDPPSALAPLTNPPRAQHLGGFEVGDGAGMRPGDEAAGGIGAEPHASTAANGWRIISLRSPI